MTTYSQDLFEEDWASIQNTIKEILECQTTDTTIVRIIASVHRICNAGNNRDFRSREKYSNMLYERLEDHFSRYVKELYDKSRALEGDPLLSFYIDQWKKYSEASRVIHHCFRHLNRFYIKLMIDEGRLGFYVVYSLLVWQWRRVMFNKDERVMDAVINSAEKHRKGERSTDEQIELVMRSIRPDQVDRDDKKHYYDSFYAPIILEPLQRATSAFYQEEGNRLIRETNIQEYIISIETLVENEKKLAQNWLPPKDAPKLEGACNNALIADHSQDLLASFQDQLMNRAYAGDTTSPEPHDYVNSFMEVYTPYRRLAGKGFSNDERFMASLDKFAGDFINRNQSAILVAKYADSVLRDLNGDDGDDGLRWTYYDRTLPQMPFYDPVWHSIESIVTIFRYIDGKDSFIKIYFEMLVLRLVYNRSSKDPERTMIDKLTQASSFKCTYMLQRMLDSRYNNVSGDWRENVKRCEDIFRP